MISLSGNIVGNTVTVTDESLRQYDGQTVTITVSENHVTHSGNLESQLDALRTGSYSTWGEDAQAYLDRLRASDRVF